MGTFPIFFQVPIFPGEIQSKKREQITHTVKFSSLHGGVKIVSNPHD